MNGQVIPTKSRYELKQYNPAKPYKCGYKNQVLSSTSEFSYKFDIFAGEQSNVHSNDTSDFGVTTHVATRFTATVGRNVSRKVFYEDCSIARNCESACMNTSTVKLNRVENAEMPPEKSTWSWCQDVKS